MDIIDIISDDIQPGDDGGGGGQDFTPPSCFPTFDSFQMAAGDLRGMRASFMKFPGPSLGESEIISGSPNRKLAKLMTTTTELSSIPLAHILLTQAAKITCFDDATGQKAMPTPWTPCTKELCPPPNRDIYYFCTSDILGVSFSNTNHTRGCGLRRHEGQ